MPRQVKSPLVCLDHLVSTGRVWHDGKGTVYFVGSIIFAVLAIVLVVAFISKWRRSND